MLNSFVWWLLGDRFDEVCPSTSWLHIQVRRVVVRLVGERKGKS
jgi:hypothetical protein